MRGLVTAGPLVFESELTACLGSSVNTLCHNGFAHRTGADHSETLAGTNATIRTVVRWLHVVEDG